MTETMERRTQILEAAFAEFASKGFRGATIKSIADRAGLQSPTLIYWYFPTKEDLFQAVIESRGPVFQLLGEASPMLDQPPDVALTMFGRAFLAVFERPAERQLIRLLLSEASQRPEVVNMMGERIAVPVLAFLKLYLGRQVELGRLRPHDSRSSARLFLGSLIPVALSIVLIPALRADGLTPETHVQNVVDIFLQGLRVEAED